MLSRYSPPLYQTESAHKALKSGRKKKRGRHIKHRPLRYFDTAAEPPYHVKLLDDNQWLISSYGITLGYKESENLTRIVR